MKPGTKLLLKLRWVLLVLWLLALLSGVTYFYTDFESQDTLIIRLMLFLYFFSQWLFLRPGRHFLFKMANDPRPMKLSIALLAVVMTVTTMGMVFCLIEILHIEMGVSEFFSDMGVGFFYFSIALSWFLWAVFFYWRWRVCSINRYTALARILRTCFAGTLLELITSLCAYATLKDPEDCYCARGSYIGICFGCTLLLWLFGPGVAMLFIYERQKRLYRRTICTKCKYDLRASLNQPSTVCPECGTPFSPDDITRSLQLQLSSTHGIESTTPRDR